MEWMIVPGSGLPDQVSNAIIHHVTCKIFTAFTARAHDCPLNHSMAINKAFDRLTGHFAE